MTEQEKVEKVLDTDVEEGSDKYIQTITELKKNSVPKEKYSKLEEENKQLLNALANGQTITSEAEEQKPTADELRAKLFAKDSNLTNLEFCKNALALRKELIENGEQDPFVGQGTKFVPDSNDYERAEAVAEAMQEAIDECDGDSSVFTALLMSKTKDVKLTKPR